MKRLFSHRPSPALVIACIALFVSLSGVSYGLATGIIDSRELRNNTIRTQDLRNNDIRAIDIRNSTIRGRDVALNTLTGSDIAESKLKEVPSAVTAGNANTLGGIGPSGFLRSDSGPFIPLGLRSEWVAVPEAASPAYYKDGLGFVHLHGGLRSVGGEALVATLPVGARPGTVKRFPVYSENDANLPVVAGATIEPDGEIRLTGAAVDNLVTLDGISFRAGY